MEDIAPGLLERVREKFEAAARADGKLNAFLRKVELGTATLGECGDYADRLGELLTRAMAAVVTPEVLPNGILYQNIAEKLLGPTLRDVYTRVNESAARVQKAEDEARHIGLNAVKPDFPDERVRELSYVAGRPENTVEQALSYLQEPVRTISRSFFDDFVQENAKTRWRAGMDPVVSREAAGGCCEWCAALAGNYPYEEASKDVYRRHRFCRCTVTYSCDGRAQDVWSKKYYDVDAETIKERAEYGKELIRSRAEKNGVANSGERGIIQEEMFSLSSHNMHNSSDVLYERVQHVQPIPGYDDVFIHGDAWGVATRNADGTEVSIPNDEFIKTLKELTWENGAIRLCSCSAGEKDKGLACLVAREMGIPVMAPTTEVWVDMPDDQGVSTMKLYEDKGNNKPDYNKPGIWRLFMPDGSIEEVKT